jgi:hypothetical protein
MTAICEGNKKTSSIRTPWKILAAKFTSPQAVTAVAMQMTKVPWMRMMMTKSCGLQNGGSGI